MVQMPINLWLGYFSMQLALQKRSESKIRHEIKIKAAWITMTYQVLLLIPALY